MQKFNSHYRNKWEVTALSILMFFIFTHYTNAQPQIEYEQSVLELETQIEALEVNKSEKENQAISLLQRQAEIKQEILDLTQQINVLDSDIEPWLEKLAVKEQELAEIESKLDELYSELINLDTSALVVQAENTLNEINQSRNNIALLQEELIGLQTTFNQSISSAESEIVSVTHLKNEFVSLVTTWIERIDEIILQYQVKADDANTPELADALNKYVESLEQFKLQYQSFFDGIIEIYNSQIVSNELKIIQTTAVYEGLISANNEQAIFFETYITNKEIELNAIQVSKNEMENERLANQNQIEVDESRKQEITNEIAMVEQEVVAHSEQKLNIDDQLQAANDEEKSIASLIADNSLVLQSIESSITQLEIDLEEFIANNQPEELSREEHIELARLQLENIPMTELGRCQADQSKGVLVACFEMGQETIVAINHEDLMAIGVDLRGVPKESIGIFATDINAVPQFVDAADLFDESSVIEIATKPYDSIYTDNRVYQIFVNIDEPFNLNAVDGLVQSTSESASISSQVLVIDNNDSYTNVSRLDGGWYDANAFTFLYKDYTANLTFEFELDEFTVLDKMSELAFEVAHSLTASDSVEINVYVNDQALISDFPEMSAYGEPKLLVNVGENVLKTGLNTVKFEINKIGRGLRGGIEVNDLELLYQRQTALSDQTLIVQATSDNDQAEDVIVSGFTSTNASAFAFLNNKTIRYSLSDMSMFDAISLESAAGQQLVLVDEKTKVDLMSVRAYDALPDSGVEYLIISHSDFIDSQAIDDLVLLRSNEYSVKVIDVDEIYAQVNGGTFDAYAIKEYLSAMVDAGTKMVLLVGDDTHDYKNRLGENTPSFIPSLHYTYPRLGVADKRYVDIDDDLYPDAAIGRMPVETVQELVNIVDKTIAYENHDYSNKALTITNYSDGLADLYDGFLDRNVFNYTRGNIGTWSLDKFIIDPEDGVLTSEVVEEARQGALTSLNEGVSLTVYTGHNNTTVGHTLNDSHIPLMQNAFKPTVLLSIDSYSGSYAQDNIGPYGSVKAESILTAKDVGAALVIANSSLTGFANYQIELLKSMLINNTVGESHQGARSSGGAGMYNILGDPALKLKAVLAN